jgi:uncharacterized protein
MLMLSSELIFILIILIILVATVIKSAFGFGDALLAMPLLALFMNMKTTVPLVALVGFVTSLIIVIRYWKSAYIKGLWVLILYCILGIPLGLFFLKNTDDRIVKLILALLIISFSTINLAKPDFLELKSNKFVWIFGLFSGMLGGAYNTNGPPIIIYGKLKKWEPDNFRAILQSVLLPTNLFIIIGQGSAGFWTSEVIDYFIICIPVILIGTIIGGLVHRKLSGEKFNKYVDCLLIIIGIVLLVNIIFL